LLLGIYLKRPGTGGAGGEFQTVTVEQLQNEFRENFAEFKRRYLGKNLIVTGEIIGMDSTILHPEGEWTVTLIGKGSDPNRLPWITCRTPGSPLESFFSIRIADVITVAGHCDQVEENFVFLRDCRLREHIPQRK
jgi:hypothetical protein